MNTASAPGCSPLKAPCADPQSPAAQVDALRQLLLQAARAMCSSDAPQVQTACEELTQFAVNLRPAWGELLPGRNHLTAAEAEQQRQSLLRPLLDARAVYLAILRRWRRSLRLRRSLLEMHMDLPAVGGDELSRWC